MPDEPREFSPEVLKALIDKIHKDPALVDKLEKDWRAVVKSHFRLPPGEERKLAELPPEKVKHIQDYLVQAAKHLRQRAGGITGKLVKRSPEERTDKLAYDVEIEMTLKKK